MDYERKFKPDKYPPPLTQGEINYIINEKIASIIEHWLDEADAIYEGKASVKRLFELANGKLPSGVLMLFTLSNDLKVDLSDVAKSIRLGSAILIREDPYYG